MRIRDWSSDVCSSDLYSWPTPNGHKVHIMLEEVGLPYNVNPIDIGAGDQFAPDFLKISPNNKMPAIVDSDGPGGQPYSARKTVGKGTRVSVRVDLGGLGVIKKKTKSGNENQNT